MWSWRNRIPGSTFLERAQNTIDIISEQLPEGSEVTQATVRVTLRHPAMSKGIVASAFCRKSHTVVLLPVLGAALGIKKRDRVGNPFVRIVTVDEAVALGKQLAKAMQKWVEEVRAKQEQLGQLASVTSVSRVEGIEQHEITGSGSVARRGDDPKEGATLEARHPHTERKSPYTVDASPDQEDTMTKITIPAACVKQGELVIYTTSIKVKYLVADHFYSIDTLDPENKDDKGFQRLLNTARAKRLADYIVKGQDSRDAFLPTSVFLATDKTIPFNETDNTIEIDTTLLGAFSVVDGQHRLEGLKMAARKDPRVLDFEVPVNLAGNLPYIAQMCHFLIVNTTQKSVDKAVEQRIISRLTQGLDIEDIPSLPKWILNTVQRGEIDKALQYLVYLNNTADSPWYGKIRMANEDSKGKTINQKSFVRAVVKYVLTANNPLTIFKDFDKEKRVFSNYWKAITGLLDNGNDSVLYKYNGVELFCKFSIPFFMKLQERGDFKVATMEEFLRSCFENVEGEYAGVGHPEWWTKGSSASFLNAGAINVVSQEMTKALHRASMKADEIEL